MIKLSVIIVSYNVKYYLEQCLRSVFLSSQNMDVEVFVVDNASSDDSPNYLRGRFPKEDYPFLHIISNLRNVGFGRANNQAVAKAKGQYVLFLNPDTLLSEKTLTACIQYADEHPDLGGLGTMMMHDNGNFAYESRRGMPTPWASFCKMTGLTSLFPHSKTFGKYYMRYLDKEKASEIEIISGAFMMTRKEVLDKAGSFDEGFFMYGEDIDLSYRFLLSGYHNYYLPSPILHYKGESTKKNTFKYVHVFYNAMLIFFKKHYHSYWLGFSIPVKLAILFSALIALVKQQFRLLRKFLLPIKSTPPVRMLYVGNHSEAVKSLVEEWGLDMDYKQGNERDVLAHKLTIHPEGYANVVYDTADFSYDFMLNKLKNSSHCSYLGVYHSNVGVMVTGSKVYVPQTIAM